MKKIKCKVTKNDLLISIPKDLLIFALEDERRVGYNPIKIVNKKLFFKEFCKNLLETNSQEDGSAGFYRLLDDCAEELYENGSLAIEDKEVD